MSKNHNSKMDGTLFERKQNDSESLNKKKKN